MNILKQSYVKYALIMSGVVTICLLTMEVTGQNKSFEHSPITVFATMLAPIVVWYLGIREKKKQLKGKLSYKQGLAEGFKIGVAYAIISPFIFLGYYLLVNPAIVASVREAYKMKDATDATVIQVDMLIQFISSIVFGTLYGAIFSLFLKTKSK